MSRSPAVLSIDLECFTHLPAYRNARGETERREVGLSAVDELLDVFDARGVEATFFVVSDIAERRPDLLARVAEAGHEIGSHTYHHRHLSELSERERREELGTSKEVLERVTGTSVTGFRAPSFDVPPEHFTMLADAGYEYDSSVAPCRSIPGWYGGEHSVKRPCSARQLADDAPAGMVELPIAVMPGLGLPLTGTWLRFFGARYVTLGMRLFARRGVAPVLYVHPWEFADLPSVAGVPRRVYWRTGAWMWRALSVILAQPFEFVTARSLLESAGFPPQSPSA